MSDIRDERPSAEKDAAARLAAVKDLLDEATGYSVPYKPSRFMPIDSAFTNALRNAVEGRDIPPAKEDK